MIQFSVFNIIRWSMVVVYYVIGAICLYRIGRRREIRGSWAAWIPLFGVEWMLGSIADHYDRWRSGKDRHLRIWIPIATLAVLISNGIMLYYSYWMTKAASGPVTAGTMTGMSIWLLVMLVLLSVVIAACVLSGIVMYRVYYSCIPKRAVLLTVMDLVFSTVFCIGPIVCLLCAYRKDDGFTLSEIVNEEEERKRLELYN